MFRIRPPTIPAPRAGILSAGGVPPAGRTLCVIGQDRASMLTYLDAVAPDPAGLMFYTDIRRLAGLERPADDGGAVRHAGAFAGRPEHRHRVLQLGLWLVGQLDAINRGRRDRQIARLAAWLRGVDHPVYLRIGYEFDGPWNRYHPRAYRDAFRRIVIRLRDAGARNVAPIWHSAAVPPPDGRDRLAWYPGEAYVDWIGLSVFRQFAGDLGTTADLDAVLDLAAELGHPVGIVESTPFGGIGPGAWASWFAPLFRLIDERDIRMLSYINADWERQRRWRRQGWGDCRIQGDPALRVRWLDELARDRYLHAGAALFGQVGYASGSPATT